MRTKSGLPGGCGMPSVYAAVMYSLVSHIAVVGASVRRYSTRTSAPASAAAPYEGRGVVGDARGVMMSACKEGDRHEHQVGDDEQQRRERHPAGGEIGIAGNEDERGSPADTSCARVRPREGSGHEIRGRE